MRRFGPRHIGLPCPSTTSLEAAERSEAGDEVHQRDGILTGRPLLPVEAVHASWIICGWRYRSLPLGLRTLTEQLPNPVYRKPHIGDVAAPLFADPTVTAKNLKYLFAGERIGSPDGLDSARSVHADRLCERCRGGAGERI